MFSNLSELLPFRMQILQATRNISETLKLGLKLVQVALLQCGTKAVSYRLRRNNSGYTAKYAPLIPLIFFIITVGPVCLVECQNVWMIHFSKHEDRLQDAQLPVISV